MGRSLLFIFAFLSFILSVNPSSVHAQMAASADIQAKADGKASTTVEVASKAGGQVVIEILASGYTGAFGVSAKLTPSVPAAITNVTGAHAIGRGAPGAFNFPANPIIKWTAGDAQITFQSGGLTTATESGDGLKVIGEITLTLSDPFVPFEITLTEVKINTTTETTLNPGTVLKVIQQKNNLISNVNVNRKHNGATITWTTRYAGTNDVVTYNVSGSTTTTTATGTLTTESTAHTVALTGLTAGTTYQYQISSTSTSGELNPTTTRTFQTRSSPDTRPVTISNLQMSADTTFVTFTWTTSRLADTRIKIASAAGATVAETQADAEGKIDHSIKVSNLVQNTAYTATLTSRGVGLDDLITDDLMTEAQVTSSKTQDFKTKAAAKDLRFNGAPTVTTTEDQATITVRLNQPASATVDYEPGTRPSSYGSSVSSTANNDVQVLTLSQLDANTTYSFRVTATNDPQLAGQSPTSGSTWNVPLSEAKTAVTTDPVFTNQPWSRSLTFKTKPGQGPVPSITTGPKVFAGSTRAIFNWTTNVETDGKVFVGTLGAGGTLGTPDEFEYTGTKTMRHVLTATGLTPRTRYGYRIEGTAEDGQTYLYDPQNSKAAKTAAGKLQVVGSGGGFGSTTTADTQLPLITRGPTVVNATGTSLTIEWDTDEYATSAVSYGLSAETLDGQEINGTPATTHRITLTGLSAGTTYAYRVAATDISDNGPVQSQVGVATTLSQPDLTAPVFSGAPALSYRSDTRADIRWATNEFTTGEIAYGLSAGNLDQVITLNELTNAQTAALTGLTVGTTYHYQVTVRDYNGNGPTQSQVLTFQTLATADTQVPVISSVVVTPSDSAVVVTWTSDEVASSIVLFGSSGGSLDNNISSINSVKAHRIVLANLQPETPYSYQVQSYDLVGNGPAQSEETTFTTLSVAAAQAPAAPTGLAAKAGNAAVQLTWSAAASTATGLILERAAGEGAFTSLVTLDPVTSYLDKTVTNGTAYRYRLRATGLFQRTGEPSTATAAITPMATGGPSRPSFFAIQGNQTTPTIVINNSTPVAAGDALTYTFQLSTTSNFSDVVAVQTVASGAGRGSSDPTGITAYTVDRTLQNGSTYHYRVKSNDGFSDSPFLTGSFKVNASASAYPGDLTGDRQVNLADFIQFARAYGTSTENANFNANADFDGNGSIALSDFIQFASVFGKQYIQGGSAGKPAVVVAYGQDSQARFKLTGRFVQNNAAGRELAVDIRLADVANLRGYGMELQYDPAALQFINATDEGDTFLKSDNRSAELFAVLDHNPETGQIYLGSAVTQGSPVSGAGTLATLRFRLTDADPANADLHIAQGILFDFDLNARLVQNLGDRLSLIPTEFTLERNFPNPFNPETTIRYAIPEASKVTLVIYNVLGQEVTRLVNVDHLPGYYTIAWDGKDMLGRNVSSGVYLYRIQAGDFNRTHKMLLLK